MQERFNNLRSQVDELLKWKEENQRVQIPLSSFGANSIDIMHQNHLVVTSDTSTTVGFYDTWLEVNLNDDIFLLPAVLS
jgi:hypothetical protein